MIKKILLTLGICLISLVGFTHGISQQWFSNGLYNTTYSNLRDQTLNLYIPTYYAFYTTVGDTQYNSIYAIYDKIFFYWDTEGILSIYNGVTARNSATKGGLTLNKFYICDYISGDFNSFTNCTQYDYDSDTVNTYLNSTVSTDRIIYGDGKVSNYEVNLVSSSIPFLAFSIEGVQKTILFYSPIGYIYNSPSSFAFGLPNVNGQVNYNVSFTGTYDITTFPDYYLGNSPIIPSLPLNPGISLNSVEGAIKYFEDNYGRNKNICYAGIDNLTSLYGDPVSFNYGSGLNIFEVFSGLYGNTDVNNVYVWLNSWLLNYEQWYNTNGDPIYLSIYNSGTNQVDLYYDNLAFPFENKPVAINFLVSNIEDFSVYSTQGSEVVSYCNLKINNGSFEDIIDQSTKNNINTYIGNSNINDGLNEDGSIRGYDNIDAFLSSGVELAFSGDTTVSNTLKNFFTEFEEVLDLSDINTSIRILPSWLVTAFLFVVLFKLLRRRNG